MSEINTESEKPTIVGAAFYDDMNWEYIKFNKPSREDFLRIRSKYEKCFATFLGGQDQLSFYMFKPLSWPDFKEIRTKGLDKLETHEYIIGECLLFPKFKTFDDLEAGVALTLVYQILAQSNFLKDPSSALNMIVQI